MSNDTIRWVAIGALVFVGHLCAFASLYAWVPEVPASIAGKTGAVTATVRIETIGEVSNALYQPKVEDVKLVESVPTIQKPVVNELGPVEPVVKEKPLVKEIVKPVPVRSLREVKPKEPVISKASSIPKASTKPKATSTTKAILPSKSLSTKPFPAPVGNPNSISVVSSTGAPTADFVGPSTSADYLKNPHPKYPKMSLRRKEEGTVWLALTVTADGRAKDVRVLKSCSYPRLDNAALNAVKDWRFIPAKRLGRPVEADYELPIHFKLRQ